MVDDKLSRAKSKLMLEHPYFGTIVSSLELLEDSSVRSFMSDGESLFYNEKYLSNLSQEEVEFTLANGAMHSILMHQSRGQSKEKKVWQTATDYVVNAMLVAEGLELPEYANYHSKFHGMYAEEIYSHLLEDMSSDFLDEEAESSEKKDEKSADDLATNSTLVDILDMAISDDVKSSIGDDFEQIFQKMRKQDNLPKELNLLMPTYFSDIVGWRELLYSYISSYSKNIYSFSPPSTKYLYRGIYLPSLSSDLLRIVIGVDTSGSIDEELLASFLGEISSLVSQYPNYEIDLIMIDDKIQSVQQFVAGESIEYVVKGGGGTDFRPLFTYIDESIDDVNILLYFTDGDGIVPNLEPIYDVLWIVPYEKEMPFGEIVVLN